MNIGYNFICYCVWFVLWCYLFNVSEVECIFVVFYILDYFYVVDIYSMFIFVCFYIFWMIFIYWSYKNKLIFYIGKKDKVCMWV